MQLLCWILHGYVLICFVRVITSWLSLEQQGGVFGSIATLSYSLTEPLFATVRRSLPMPGDIPIDLAPAVVIIVLGLLSQFVCGLQ